MKTTRMICDCCGKEFYSEYYAGGYIDHYYNFARIRKSLGKNLIEDFHGICYDRGGKVRHEDDIKSRFECYLQWENVPDDMKKQMGEMIHEALDDITKAREKAQKIVGECTILEKKYLIEEAKRGCNI